MVKGSNENKGVNTKKNKGTDKTVEAIVKEENSHNVGHSKKSAKYQKLIEGYKRRNRLIEVIIGCVVLLLVFILACNKTFFKTNYTKEVGNAVIDMEIPLFTYYVDSDDEKIVFKTLRKSENTRKFYDEFLNSSNFGLHYCGNEMYYYNNEGKYFIYDIEVEKSFVVKTITINYSTVDVDLFCETVKDRD